jgi:hypothetical protein
MTTHPYSVRTTGARRQVYAHLFLFAAYLIQNRGQEAEIWEPAGKKTSTLSYCLPLICSADREPLFELFLLMRGYLSISNG